MEKKKYQAPQMKSVECKTENLICASVKTEGFTVGESYNDSDWE